MVSIKKKKPTFAKQLLEETKIVTDKTVPKDEDAAKGGPAKRSFSKISKKFKSASLKSEKKNDSDSE